MRLERTLSSKAWRSVPGHLACQPSGQIEPGRQRATQPAPCVLGDAGVLGRAFETVGPYPHANCLHRLMGGSTSIGGPRSWMGSRSSRTRALLVTTSALATSLLGLSGPALAANECGQLVSDSATCTSSGNFYPDGINYSTN